MQIWEHGFTSRSLVEVPYEISLHKPWTPYHPANCIFCNEPLSFFHREATIKTTRWKSDQDGHLRLGLCMKCGWWTAAFDYGVDLGINVHVRTHSVSGALRLLDLSDISVPTEELRRYLIAHYQDRFSIHPKK